VLDKGLENDWKKRGMKFGVEVDRKRTYTYENIVPKPAVTNMAMMPNIQLVCDKFGVGRIYTKAMIFFTKTT
jgi:hypothetical protein